MSLRTQERTAAGADAPPRSPFRLLLPILLASSCGRETDRPAQVRGDLLARAPDQVIEQPGELRPDDAGWPEHAFDGWQIDEASEGVAWSLVREASLRLPLLAPADAQLELELVPPPGLAAGGQQRVCVRLNDRALGELELDSGRTRHALSTPAAAWRRGDNVLSLRGSLVGRNDQGKNVFLGLRRLSYSGHSVRVERSRAGITLPAGCGLVYRLESVTDTRLRVEGSARGGGRLELHAREVDPLTGSIARADLETLGFSPERDVIRGECALPRVAGILALELVWTSAERESSCELSELRLVEHGEPRRPSVLFVSIDTLSAQHMSLYGHPRETTPHLEEFARDAVLFENCRANAPWTIPSYMSQFTGLLPGAHMLDRTGDLERMPETWELHQLAPDRWTLAEFFRAAGYRTAAFVDNPWLVRGFGFTQGFEEYDGAAAEIGLEDPEGGLRYTVPRVLEWLDRRAPEESFFLFVQAFDPHAPYRPVPPWKGRFERDGLIDPEWQVPVGRGQAFAYGCIPDHVAAAERPGEELPGELAVAPIAAAYDEKVLEIDAAMAELLDGLKERGLYDELLIVFSADHGESTTGHDLYFNHSLLYNDVLAVPLIVRLPGGERAGAVIEEVVQLVDLHPTLVDLVRGLPERGLHGVSLLPLVRGEGPARGVGFAEWGMMEQASVENGGWKLIASQPLFARPQTQVTSPRLDRQELGELCPELASGFHTDEEIEALLARHPEARRFLEESLAGPFFELYYLPDDPFETRDLAQSHPEEVARLLEYLVAGRELGAKAREQAVFAPPEELDPEELEELEELGYGGQR